MFNKAQHGQSDGICTYARPIVVLQMSLIMLEKGRQGTQPPLVSRPVQESPKRHLQRSLPAESSYSSGHLQSMLTPSQSSAYNTR